MIFKTGKSPRLRICISAALLPKDRDSSVWWALFRLDERQSPNYSGPEVFEYIYRKQPRRQEGEGPISSKPVSGEFTLSLGCVKNTCAKWRVSQAYSARSASTGSTRHCSARRDVASHQWEIASTTATTAKVGISHERTPYSSPRIRVAAATEHTRPMTMPTAVNHAASFRTS